MGKPYLAHLNEEAHDEILGKHALTEVTPNTISDREVVDIDLWDIADHGFAPNVEERIVGMRAIGVPIVSGDDELLGVVSVSGPTTRLTGDWYRKDVPELVCQSARVAGIKAKYPLSVTSTL